MKLYAAIDLHSNNSVLVILDETDRIVLQKRLSNRLERILAMLVAYREAMEGIAVESTYNWYWLVDGLMEAGYRVHLVNTAAVKQYEGLKYREDADDARWLAHLLRLGILPQGYIYPRAERGVRDLMRQRSRLVQQRSQQVLSIENSLSRELGERSAANQIKRWQDTDVDRLPLADTSRLAVKSRLAVMRCIDEQIDRLEAAILETAKLRPDYQGLLTVNGIGKVLALTIALETGDVSRFPSVGDFSSYCRCVGSEHLSNGKKKGSGNVKSGNRHLAWAFVEAANFAVRYEPTIKRFYQRKSAKTRPVVAIKAVAHKLARACYHVMRDRVPFDVQRAFA
ncbi:MAG: IS110 family transposase [Candidatus Accumulibacter sp.]|uniref:IS110 family transposase n=1 Tax=unclassified Candidatus Accumulibacter TaxID=2619054 RepID=UPI001A371B42|nr:MULTISPECIES: IS110 family transposase [unclassified Candidatus Accumulibacter]MBL8366701.1 IS110 family transposase [Accumulibacter sp.]